MKQVPCLQGLCKLLQPQLHRQGPHSRAGMRPGEEKEVQRLRRSGKLSGRRGVKEGDMGCWWTARSHKRAARELGGHQPQVNESDAYTIPAAPRAPAPATRLPQLPQPPQGCTGRPSGADTRSSSPTLQPPPCSMLGCPRPS